MTIGGRRSWRLITTLALLAGFISPAASQPAQPSPPREGAVAVTNSPGANTQATFNDNRTIIYEQARRDALTQQLVATMLAYSRTRSTALVPLQEMPVHLYGLRDPASRPSPRNTGAIYVLVAGRFAADDLGVTDRVARCTVGEGILAMGGVLRSTTHGSTAQVSGRLMTRDDDALLRQFCEGLRRPVSSLMAVGAGANAMTVFDFMSGRYGFVAAVLLPDQFLGQDLEEGAIRNYWVPGLISRYVRVPRSDRNFGLALLSQLDGLRDGGTAEIPFQLPFNFAGPTAYPRQAQTEFGPRIDRLSRDWDAYLARAAMTFRNERQPLMTGGRWNRRVPRFTMAQVGSREFWLAANDLHDFEDQLNCIGSQFLVDKEYVAPDGYAAPVLCALDEIRLPTP
jgi:hypothetical protein